MNRFVIIGVVFLVMTAVTRGAEIMEAFDAVSENQASVRATSINGYQETRVDVENKTDDDLNLRFSGTGFLPSNNAQRIGVTRTTSNDEGAASPRGSIFFVASTGRSSQIDETVVQLGPGEKRTFFFESRCLDKDRPAPQSGVRYYKLVRLPKYLSTLLVQNASQSEIWAVTDGTRKSEWKERDPRNEEKVYGTWMWRDEGGSIAYTLSSDGSAKIVEVFYGVRQPFVYFGTWSRNGSVVSTAFSNGFRSQFTLKSVNSTAVLVGGNQVFIKVEQ